MIDKYLESPSYHSSGHLSFLCFPIIEILALCFTSMSSLEQNPDLEKVGAEKPKIDPTYSDIDVSVGEVLTSEKDISKEYWGVLGTWSRKLESFGVEARGIQPVEPSERAPQSYWGLCLIW
jgi:hypothetical protein